MRYRRIVLTLFAAILLGGCGVSTPGPGASATPGATVTVTPSGVPSPTATATPAPFAYPMRLKEIGHMGGEAVALAVIGERAYVQLGSAYFMTVDISNPHRPMQIGQSHRVPGGISIFAAEDNHLQIVDLSDALLVYDVSDDLNPTVTKTIPKGSYPANPGYQTTGASSKDYVFVYQEYHEENPTSKQILAIYSTHGGMSEPITSAIGALAEGDVAIATRLVARGRYVYVADNDMFRIYDLGQQPRVVDRSRQALDNEYWWPEAGTLSADAGTRPGGGGMYFFPQPFYICGDYLYTGSGYWSLKDPGAPKWVAKTLANRPCFSGFPVKDGKFSQPYGGTAIEYDKDHHRQTYVGSGVLSFLNLSDPKQPYKTDVFFTDETGSLVATSADRLYFLALDDPAAPKATFLEIFDVTDPYRPKMLGKSEAQPIYSEYDSIKLIGKYLVWDHYESSQLGLALDVSDPAHIQRDSGDSDSGVLNVNMTLISGDYAFYGSESEVRVYKLDHLSEPLSVLTLPDHPALESYGTYFQQFGDKLYVYGVIVDIADPAQPRVIALTDNVPYAIEVYGDIYYFDLLNQGIAIYQLVPN